MRRPLALLTAGITAGSLALAPAAAAVPAQAQLPTVSSGHRPGPDALYAPPPHAPQLANAAPWVAEPILISGASAYRDGEFLYQDFLYDDAGAIGGRDPAHPHEPGQYLFSPRMGTFSYPRDAVYANNAADLVELRVKPLADATAFRVTLNTLIDPERAAFTIAIGTSDAPRAWPHGAGISSPAELFLTVHGSTAELLDAATGEVRGPATATVDLTRRQVDVRVPRSSWDPGTGNVRLAAGTGLWDTATGSYLKPMPGEASATAPGGGTPTGVAIFNLAFRFDEPMPDVERYGLTLADSAAGAQVEGKSWREYAQAQALTTGDATRFFVEVDFAKLAAGVRDDSGVPKDGPMDRILASRHVFGQGIDYARRCYDPNGNYVAQRPCEGTLRGQLQPYAIYVPRRPPPPAGYGLTLLLHGMGANYNMALDSKYQSQLGERGTGTIVITPHGRGPEGFNIDFAEADTFEVWADVARRYPLDPEWTVVSGYSMGGEGTYRMLARWPDLFARGFSVVGAPYDTQQQLPSLRNTPLMAWTAAADELEIIDFTEEVRQDMAALGLRYVADLFQTADHLTLGTNDEYAPAAEFLGEHRVDRAPPHVTYVVAPGGDHTGAGVVADHAYWLSDLRVRSDTSPMIACVGGIENPCIPDGPPISCALNFCPTVSGPLGTIDARSEGFGVGDPQPLGEQTSQGVLLGGSHGPMPYLHRVQDWGPAPAIPKADRLEITAINIATVTVDPQRAGVTCDALLDVDTDGPLSITLAGCPGGPHTFGGDLQVTSLSASNTKGVRQGEKVTIIATVANTGDGAAAASSTEFLLDGARMPGGPLDTPALGPGESVTLSLNWDTRGVKGEHTITAIADSQSAVEESNEDNNRREITVSVRGNKIQNPSFEQSSDGSSPDAWSSSGSAAYEMGGSDGLRKVSTEPGGSWTSEAVPIEAGSSYDASVVAAGADGTLLVQQLTSDGSVLSTAAQAVLPSEVFTFTSVQLTALAGAAQVRVVLLGGLTGKTTFDDVGLFGG